MLFKKISVVTWMDNQAMATDQLLNLIAQYRITETCDRYGGSYWVTGL